MWLTATALIALAMPVQQQTDTTIAVRAGAKLEIENYGGETEVTTWDRDAIRVHAEHGVRDRVEIRVLGSVVTLKSQSRMGPPRAMDYTITVPVHTDISISGVYQDVSLDGVQGTVEVGTVNGDVTLRGGDGFVSLKSVEGDVRVSNAKGRLVLESVNGGVRVENSTGDIQATTINGDVELLGVTSSSVEANTVNGDVLYDGTIEDTGRYDFSTNNGDITATVAETANATAAVETFNGEFESSYAVRLTQSRKNRFTFVLGTGAARLSLNSFSGTIRIARPGELRGRGRGTGRGTGSGRNQNENRNRNNNNNDNDYSYDYKYDHAFDFKFDFKQDFKLDILDDLNLDIKLDIERELQGLRHNLKDLRHDLKHDLQGLP
ncbi:MAG: hypothetical protein EXR93_04995 [Gemmatimonadetes bacterium]|nr:hypothetical protein [Gemmatimonadota bacterium]